MENVKVGDRVKLKNGQKGTVVNMPNKFWINDHEFEAGLAVEKDWNCTGEAHSPLSSIESII